MNMTNNTTATIFENISKAGAISPTTLNGLPGMSSLEIAEITGKQHGHVLRDISKMLKELDLVGPSKFGESSAFVETSYKNSQGKTQPLSILDKELTFTLLSRYSFKLSNLIVKRWLELEGSGFERVSVQATVVHLGERERDIRSVALKDINKGRRPRKLSAEEKEIQSLTRAAKRYEDANPMH